MSDENLPKSTQGPIVAPRRYEPGDVIILNAGTMVESKQRFQTASDTSVTFEDLSRPGEFVQYSHMQMAELEKTPGYRYLPGGRTQKAVELQARTGARRINELAEAEQTRALMRDKWVSGFKEMEAKGEARRSHKSMKAALSTLEAKFKEKGIDAGQKPSLKTMCRWLKAFEKSGNVVDLRAYYIRRYGPKLRDVTVDRVMDDCVRRYMTRERPTKAAIYSDMRHEIALLNHERQANNQPLLTAPGYRSFNAALAAQGEFALHASRHGIESAKRRFVMVTNGAQAKRPGERYEIDAWEIPMFAFLDHLGMLKLLSPKQIDTLKLKRWIACAIIDCATRLLIGMRIGPSENADLVLATIEMTMTDKKPLAHAAGATTPWTQACCPEAVYLDMGAANTGNRVRYALAMCGVDMAHPPAGHPWLRGIIERSFGTDHLQLFIRFSGRTFENPIVKGDYNAQKLASLTLQELCDAYVRFKIDVYNNSPHSGLMGETPFNAWNRLTQIHGLKPLPDREVRRLAFGILLTRVLDNRGVRVLNLHYNSDELHKHFCHIGHGETVRVKVARHDLGAVSVEIGDGNWITVPCMQQDMTDVAVTEWMVALSQLRAKFGAQAKIADATRLAAIRDLRKLGETAILRSIAEPLVTPEQIDKAEKSTRFGFHPGEADNPAEVDDTLGKMLPASNPPAPSKDAPALPTLPAPDTQEKGVSDDREPTPEPRVRKFGIED